MDQQFEDTSEELEQLETDPEEEVEPQEPVLVRVRIDGKTLMVTEEVADALQAREAAFQKKISEQGAELGRIRQQVKQEPRQEQQADSGNDDLEFFQSPTKAFQKHTESLETRITDKIRQEYAVEQSRREYWGQFYKDNPSLVGKEKFVHAIVAQEYDSLKDLPPDQSRTELGRIIGEMVGTQESGERKTLPNKQATSERASNPPGAPRKAPQQVQPALGLSAAIKARAEARRRAQFNQKDEK